MTSQTLPPEARAILDDYRAAVAALTERAARALRAIPGMDDPGGLFVADVIPAREAPTMTMPPE